MVMDIPLHFVSTIVILISTMVTIYLATKLKNVNLKNLSLILSIFILTHGAYHIAGFFGFKLLADGVLEPLSAAILIFFGIIYSNTVRLPSNNMSTKNMMAIVAVSPTIVIAMNNGGSRSNLLLTMNVGTIILLLVALGIFVWLAARSKNIRTFQFQISVFIVIWMLGDLVSVLQDSGIVVFPSSLQGSFGSEIHVVSMVFFSLMLWLRYYHSERSGKKLIHE